MGTHVHDERFENICRFVPQRRAQVAELTATLNSAVAVESAPRREKELTRQMQLMAALNRAVADIRRLGILV